MHVLALMFATLTLTPQNAEIVIAANTPPATMIAVNNLTNFLHQAFGQAVSVVRARTPNRKAIMLDGTAEGLPRDGFRLTATEDFIRIEGRDSMEKDPESIVRLPGEQEWGPQFERATLFGVIEFLERYVGCRFYFPGSLGTIVPKTEAICVPLGTVEVMPDFKVRRYGYEDGKVPDEILAEFGGEWKEVKKTHFYRLRMETKYLPCCHGLKKFQMLSRFKDTHPEYFQLGKDGKRFLHEGPGQPLAGSFCYSSAVTNEVYEDVKAYLSGKRFGARNPNWNSHWLHWPNAFHDNVIDVMPQDGMTPCECKKCQAAYVSGRNGNFADELIWSFTVALDRRLMADGFTGFELTQMAYYPYAAVPDVDLPKNIRVMIAKNGPYTMANPQQLKDDREEVHRWTVKTGGRVWLWNYPGKAMALNIKGPPSVCPRAWGAYYQMMASDIFGAFAESETDNWLFHYLNYYVFAKIGWNNKVDVEALLAEHFRLMFGVAADDLSAIYDIFEEKWVKGIAAHVVETSMGPLNTPPSENVIWENIYSPAEIAALGRRFDEAEAKLVDGSIELKRVRFIRKEYLGSLEKAAAVYAGRKAKLDSMSWKRGRKPIEVVPFKYGNHPKPTPVRTQVTLARTEKALVVEYVCAEPHMDKTFALDGRENDTMAVFNDDGIEFVLNPSGDRSRIFQFFCSSRGTWADMSAIKFGKEPPKVDFGWNSGATVNVVRRLDGWTARLEIPLASLGEVRERFPANFCRDRVVSDVEGASGFYSWNSFLREFRDVDLYSFVEP